MLGTQKRSINCILTIAAIFTYHFIGSILPCSTAFELYSPGRYRNVGPKSRSFLAPTMNDNVEVTESTSVVDIPATSSDAFETSLPSDDDQSTVRGEPREDVPMSEPFYFVPQKNATSLNVRTLELSAEGNRGQSMEMTRRQWFQKGAIFFGGALVVGTSLSRSTNEISTKTTNIRAVIPEVGRLEPINLTRVASETSINVTLDCGKGCVSVDSKNFTKVRTVKVPAWFPSFLAPNPQVIKVISNSELLVAATIAGSATEMFRTSLLYPLQTVKTRIQTDVHNFTMRAPPIHKQLKKLGTNVRRHVQEGNLYAGLVPSLLVTVPATGVYYGVRDVTMRMLSLSPLDIA